MIKAVYILLGLAVVFGLVSIFSAKPEVRQACTQEAKVCPDGSTVGREGPSCEFAACPDPLADDIKAHIESKADLIKLNSPLPDSEVTSPLSLSGEARGYWFFEASFPVVVTNWDGLIIAEGFATAEGDWMTEEFVPFTATISFDSPYNEGDPDFMKKGTLLMKRANPSGLLKNSDALEVPIHFAP